MPTRILIVDDEETIRDIQSSMLSDAKYKCVQTANGKEALELLDSGEKFDLVISNIMMAPIDGIELLKTTKERYPGIPVLIANPLHDEDVIKATYDLGAYSCLLLPFERKNLLEAVRGALAATYPAESL